MHAWLVRRHVVGVRICKRPVSISPPKKRAASRATEQASRAAQWQYSVARHCRNRSSPLYFGIASSAGYFRVSLPHKTVRPRMPTNAAAMAQILFKNFQRLAFTNFQLALVGFVIINAPGHVLRNYLKTQISFCCYHFPLLVSSRRACLVKKNHN